MPPKPSHRPHKNDQQEEQPDPFSNRNRNEAPQQQPQLQIPNPSMPQISKHFKTISQKNLQKQISYFGSVIQPFNMRQQQQMGNIDQDGFFVFKRGRRVRDPWLDSVGEAEDTQVADQMLKRIKQESRFLSVYEGESRLNRDLKEGEEENQEDGDEYSGGGIQQAPQQQQDQPQPISLSKLQAILRQLLTLLPQNYQKSVNTYLKKLKTDKKMQQYNKILSIVQKYRQSNGGSSQTAKDGSNGYEILSMNCDGILQKIEEIEGKLSKMVRGQIQPKKVDEQEVIQNWDDQDQQSDKNQNQKQELVNNQGLNKNKSNKQVQDEPISSSEQQQQNEVNENDQNDDIF